jgi:hypothetical protein
MMKKVRRQLQDDTFEHGRAMSDIGHGAKYRCRSARCSSIEAEMPTLKHGS